MGKESATAERILAVRDRRENPLVSILVNNYNYAEYVGRAIQSALEQTYKNTEIVVVDDGSTDSSRAVIEGFGGAVRAVYQGNGGQASAFNAGFAESQGDIICFLDSDDVFLPTKVARVVEAIGTFDTWCFHNIQWVDVNLGTIATPGIPFETGSYDFREQLVGGQCRFAPPATSGLCFRRELLSRLMPVPDAIKITSDNYLKYSSLAIATGHYLAEPLALQRIHGNNAYTGRTDSMLRANVQLATASGLRSKFPSLRPVCSRMFANGLAEKWNAGESLSAVSAAMREYLSGLPLTEQAELLARTGYKAMRSFRKKAALGTSK